jgi:hypothetical protein
MKAMWLGMGELRNQKRKRASMRPDASPSRRGLQNIPPTGRGVKVRPTARWLGEQAGARDAGPDTLPAYHQDDPLTEIIASIDTHEGSPPPMGTGRCEPGRPLYSPRCWIRRYPSRRWVAATFV